MTMDNPAGQRRLGEADGGPVRSPCISVCQLDPLTNLCIGCLRSLEEIRDWPVMPAQQKRAVLVALKTRKPKPVAR